MDQVTRCRACGAVLNSLDSETSEAARFCPGCGTDLSLEEGVSDGDPGAITILHPGLIAPKNVQQTDTLPTPVLISPEPSAPTKEEEDTQFLSSGDLEPTSPEVDLVVKADLKIQTDTARQERVELSSGLTTIGRQNADVEIDDPSVSSQHCEIEARGGEFFVRDLESQNGTFVNGERVRSAELRSGDEIRIGRTVIQFRALKVVATD